MSAADREKCKCGLPEDDPIHSYSTEWQKSHAFYPADTPLPPPRAESQNRDQKLG